VEFHDQIKILAEQVARRVVEAPPYPDDPERDPWLAADIPVPPGATPIHPGRICL